MNITVIGGSGYLGSELVFQAKAAGLDVIGTYNSHPTNLATHAFSIESDGITALPDSDAYIWAAKDYPGKDSQSVLNSLQEAGKRLLYISSDVVLDTPAQETSAYAQVKKQEELLLQGSPNTLILRIGPVVGINSSGVRDDRTKSFITKMNHGEQCTYWDNVYRSFEPVQTLAVRILELVSQKDINGTWFLGPQNRQSYYDYYQSVAAQLGLDSSKILKTSLSAKEAAALHVELDTSYRTQKKHLEL